MYYIIRKSIFAICSFGGLGAAILALAILSSCKIGPMTVACGDGELFLRLLDPEEDSSAIVIRLELEGADTEAAIEGVDPLRGRYSFFYGNDPDCWHSNLPSYGAVRYRDVYAGVDLKLHRKDGQLEYDLLLRPGAALEDVVFRAHGVDGVRVDPMKSSNAPWAMPIITPTRQKGFIDHWGIRKRG